MKCPTCGFEPLPERESTCPRCGKKTPTMFIDSHPTVNRIEDGGRYEGIHIEHYHASAESSLLIEPLKPLPDLPEIDVLPELGRLPVGSRVPFIRNAIFTGREKDLLGLAKALLYEPSVGDVVGIVQATVATGLGGIGKTQLAVEFCYRYGQYFHGVHWIQAKVDATSDTIKEEIAACGAEMGLNPWPKETDEQASLTLRTWQQGKRLIVLDNLEEPALLTEWLPQLNGLCVLITARREHWPASLGLRLQRLGLLERDKSLALLCKLAPRLKSELQNDLNMLAERLGDLPLALELAGRYLEEAEDLALKDYMKELDQAGNLLEHTSLLDWTQDNPTAHATSLAQTFFLSWKQLAGDVDFNQTARQIFLAAAFCAPNVPIPKNLLKMTVENGDGAIFNRSLRRLYDLGLIMKTDTGPSIHPLLHEFGRVLGEEEENEAKKLLSNLAETLGEMASEANQSGLPDQMKPLRAHLRALAGAAETAGLPLAGGLWNELAYHLQMVAEYISAKIAFERALAIDEAAFGPDHPEVAAVGNNLGCLLQELGDLAGARSAFERALAIDEAAFGTDHPNVAKFVNNLGSVLKDLGDLPGARAAYERALAIDEATFGPDHPNVAVRVNNLGSVLQALGDLEGARSAFERALAIDEAAFGPDHPEVAKVVNNLGSVLQALGDLQEARSACERALAIDEAAFGPNHPRVATDVSTLGLVLKDLGDFEGARSAFERALAIDEAAVGPDHPDVAIRVNNLGMVLQALGDLQGARSAYERALTIDEAAFGPDHPNVAIRVNNLGMVLKDLGDLAGSRSAFERALAIDEAAFGPDHPEFANVVNNLGLVLRALGDLEGARGAFERALAIDEAAFGPDYPGVAKLVNNVGSVLHDLGDLTGARNAFERALAIDEAAFGPDYPDIAILVNNLGRVLKDLGDLEGSRSAFERALKIFQKYLPADHRNIKIVRGNLESLDEEKKNE